jgi:hypothetical protein
MKACVARARAIRFVLFLLTASSLLAAQTQTFDLVSFTPPAGWAASQDSDHITFTFIDNSAKTFVMLAVYNSAPGSGDAEKDFVGEWKDVVAKSFSAGSAPASAAGQSQGGLKFRQGSAQVKQQNGQPAYVRFMVFPAGKRRFSVMMVATNEKALEARQAAAQSFLDSMRLVAQTAASAPASASSNSAHSGPSAAPRPGKGLSGVWMGFKTYVGNYEPQPRWYTFYDDGQIFEDIPRAGFVGFDRSASQSDSGQRSYWGAYTFSNGSGSITKPGVKYPETLQSEGAGKLKIDSAHFYLCQTVDGLRLQGAWTSLANPNDPDLDRWPVGKRPIFRFSSDGKFGDEGVFATFLKSGDPRQDAAGTGTYEIRDFTLILRFSDGRVKQLAITAMLGANAAASNDVLYIARSRFQKRK